jgi:DNA-directed RNA polymerase subunit RPC12/RpoP
VKNQEGNVNIDEYEGVTVCGSRKVCENGPFTDNMYGNCDGCGAEIGWRPHSAHGHRVFMACLDCGFKLMAEMRERGEHAEIVVTPKCQEELGDILASSRK